MADKVDEGERGVGSVKAAISMYGGKVRKIASLRNNLPVDVPDLEERGSKAQELHIAKKTVDKINEYKRTAETVTSQAEFELLKAKKIVRELTSQIEELKLKGARESIKTENHEYVEVVQELEDLKHEVSKIKLDIARVLEEKSRAENEANTAGLRATSCMEIVEKLSADIEEANEEEVLVELAQIQARKEIETIEAQRKAEEEKIRSQVQETRRKIDGLRNEVKRAKRLEEVLVITNSEADVLQNELMFMKEMDDRVKNSELLSVKKKLEAARKELASIKTGVFQLMSGMDSTRIEKNNIVKEKNELENAEVKTEKYIKKLNSKLLRLKDRLDIAKVSEQKAALMLPSFIISLREIENVKATAENEKKCVIDEAEVLKDEIQKAESATDFAEDRLQAAMQELEAIKTAESNALKKLKTLVESTVVNRAYRVTDTITISKFEYDYLSGCAAGAEEIADKKVAAAHAWADALRANAKEMEIQTTLVKREIKEMTVVPVDDTDKEHERVKGRKSVTENNHNLIAARQANFRKSVGSPLPRRQIIATSLTLKRRRKVMPKIANFFANKQVEKTGSVEESL